MTGKQYTSSRAPSPICGSRSSKIADPIVNSECSPVIVHEVRSQCSFDLCNMPLTRKPRSLRLPLSTRPKGSVLYLTEISMTSTQVSFDVCEGGGYCTIPSIDAQVQDGARYLVGLRPLSICHSNAWGSSNFHSPTT